MGVGIRDDCFCLRFSAQLDSQVVSSYLFSCPTGTLPLDMKLILYRSIQIHSLDIKNHPNQVIQRGLFDPLGGHQQPFKGSQITIPKRSQLLNLSVSDIISEKTSTRWAPTI